MRYALLLGPVVLAATSQGHAQKPIEAGIYLCTVMERAGIGSLHLEGAGPPSTFVDPGPPTKFKMQITPDREGNKPFRLVEVVYNGPDRDQAEWDDENSVLHGAYLGDGNNFDATEGKAFLELFRTRPGNEDGDVGFYHAGFEHPGGEDTNLTVRWGRCRKVE